MHAASVTSRSTLSRQQLPSASFATAITVCDVANRMRVAKRGAPACGPKVTRSTCGNGLPSANTSMLRTSTTGASIVTVMPDRVAVLHHHRDVEFHATVVHISLADQIGDQRGHLRRRGAGGRWEQRHNQTAAAQQQEATSH